MRTLSRCLLVVSVISIIPEFTRAASVALTHSVREVTPEEIAAGAPDGGFVHDFFLTSATDMLSFSNVMVNAPLFSHELASHTEAPASELDVMSPSVSAHSFITSTGNTGVAGADFALDSGMRAYFDTANLGASEGFHFARLTTNETGTFSGRVSVRGYHKDQPDNGFVYLPFEFDLTTSFEFQKTEYSLEYLLEPPARPEPVVEVTPKIEPVTPGLPLSDPDPVCEEGSADHEPTLADTEPEGPGLESPSIITTVGGGASEQDISFEDDSQGVFDVTETKGNDSTADLGNSDLDLNTTPTGRQILTTEVYLTDYLDADFIAITDSLSLFNTTIIRLNDSSQQLPEPSSLLTIASLCCLLGCSRTKRKPLPPVKIRRCNRDRTRTDAA